MMTAQEQKQREMVVAEARTWLRTPYHHAGRIKGVGVDCAMLLAEVFERVGVLPRIEPEAYPPDWHQHRDRDRFLEWVGRYAFPVDAPSPGDVVMFRFGKASSHGAIVTGWPKIIHAVIGSGVMEDLGNAPRLQQRLVGYWRMKGWAA